MSLLWGWSVISEKSKAPRWSKIQVEKEWGAGEKESETWIKEKEIRSLM